MIVNEPVMSDKLDNVSIVAGLDTVDTYGVTISGVTGAAAVEVVHGEAGIRRYLVETLSS